MEIIRSKSIGLLKERLKNFPAVAIIGPRQCGKTTLARQFSRGWKGSKHLFDLEDPSHLARLDEPMLALEDLRGLVVIDEIQRRPDLFPVLRVLVDRKEDVRFLILGSASRDLLAQSSETLAGRISYIELTGFTTELIPAKQHKKLWVRGGFPLSFLARGDEESFIWRKEFVSTFLERDIPALGFRIPANTLRRFWTMLAHYHGQRFNASEIGRSLGFSDTAIRHHLDILAGTFMIRQLKPWITNTKKRLVKSPKVYFRDTGILHSLLAIKSMDDIAAHPRLGASWEGFALEQFISHLALTDDEVYFWGVHSGAELDLVFQRGERLYGVELKYADAPRVTSSIKNAMKDLDIEKLWVVHPGKESFPLGKNINALCIGDVSSLKVG